MFIILGANGGLGAGLLEQAQSCGSRHGWAQGDIWGATRNDVDMSRESSVKEFAEKINERANRNDIIQVINATGISINGVAHRAELSDFENTLRVNLTGNFLLVKYLQAVFKERPGSSLCMLSSVVGELGVPGTIAYASSKSGLRGLCRVASKEFAKYRATVNVIELGYFNVGMISQVSSEQKAKIIEGVPLARLGEVSELFEACRFALGCGYLTGAVIKLNGGLI